MLMPFDWTNTMRDLFAVVNLLVCLPPTSAVNRAVQRHCPVDCMGEACTKLDILQSINQSIK